MDESATVPADFAALYGPLLKRVFAERARDEVRRGADPDAQARAYAARGKPEFALAYLLLSTLPDGERRALFAQAHEQRAHNTEQRAQEFDRRFHRPFPLLYSAAVRDRGVARRIQAGRPMEPGTEREGPSL